MNDDMRKLIDETRRLDAAASAGPWHERDAETENGYSTSAVSMDSADDDGLLPADLLMLGRNIAVGLKMWDAALIADYRTAAPVLAAEVERLDARLAEVERERDELRALWTAEQQAHRQTARECGDSRRDALALRAELDEALLTLAAEQGWERGEPAGWGLLGHGWRRGDLRVRRVGWNWEWSQRDARGRVRAAGVANTARGAMLAADAATTPPAPAPTRG